jgi:hypothetical protein
VGAPAASAARACVSGVQRLIGDLQQAPHIMSLALVFLLGLVGRRINVRATRIHQACYTIQVFVRVTRFVPMRLIDTNAHCFLPARSPPGCCAAHSDSRSLIVRTGNTLRS